MSDTANDTIEDQRRSVIEGRSNLEDARVRFGVESMRTNKAYVHAAEQAGGDPNGRLLKEFQDRFRTYREGWRGLPRRAFAENRTHDRYTEIAPAPLCVDVEVAAVCDLACSFCYRQYIATPDKIMQEELFYEIADQCAELGVPSMKLVWRGEPLLHPKLPEMIDYAKRKGILEVITTTNATTLDEKKSREIVEAGLDMMTYSFDGGTAETYNKMRIGRFNENTFDVVYGNIRRFAEIRDEMGSVFPRTKIQMILTEETFGEQDAFFALFDDCVDDVAVKAYTERGGALGDLDSESRRRLASVIEENGLPDDAPYWRDMEGNLFLSKGRIACEQPFQRLMITYDGRVSMCCYDWGSEHPVGYVAEEGYEKGYSENEKIMGSIQAGKKGFAEFMAQATMPRQRVSPPARVDSLKDIWNGEVINQVRHEHVCGHVEDVDVCKECPFKETYDWLSVKRDSSDPVPA